MLYLHIQKWEKLLDIRIKMLVYLEELKMWNMNTVFIHLVFLWCYLTCSSRSSRYWLRYGNSWSKGKGLYLGYSDDEKNWGFFSLVKILTCVSKSWMVNLTSLTSWQPRSHSVTLVKYINFLREKLIKMFDHLCGVNLPGLSWVFISIEVYKIRNFRWSSERRC